MLFAQLVTARMNTLCKKSFSLLVLVQRRILFKFVFYFFCLTFHIYLFTHLALGPQEHGLPICLCTSGAMDVGGGVRHKSLLRGLLFQSCLVCLSPTEQRTQSSVHGPAAKQKYLPSSVRFFALVEKSLYRVQPLAYNAASRICRSQTHLCASGVSEGETTFLYCVISEASVLDPHE